MIFYLDVEDPELYRHILCKINRCGWICTSFLSNEVTHFVTSRRGMNVERRVYCMNSRASLNVSRPDLIIKQGSIRTMTRQYKVDPRDLYDPSRNQQKNDIMTKTLAMNLTIWSVEQLCNYADEYCGGQSAMDTKQLRDSDLLQCLLQEGRGTPLNASVGGINRVTKRDTYVRFKYEFVIVNDINEMYKPMFKEFGPPRGSRRQSECYAPKLHLDNANGNCPFIKSKTTQNPKKQTKNRARIIRKKAGYCECCMERYSDIDFHANETHHRMFALSNENYRHIDEIIEELERKPKNATSACIIASNALNARWNPDWTHLKDTKISLFVDLQEPNSCEYDSMSFPPSPLSKFSGTRWSKVGSQKINKNTDTTLYSIPSSLLTSSDDCAGQITGQGGEHASIGKYSGSMNIRRPSRDERNTKIRKVLYPIAYNVK